jgi:Ser/Thr protein kinase RdoA (MazF antagonist)
MFQNTFDQLINAVTELYNGNTESLLKLTGGFQNDVFEYHDGQDSRILRVTLSTNRSKEMIQSELDFIGILSSNGVGVSIPIQSIQGNYIEEISLQGVTYYLTSFSKATGHIVNVSNPREWNREFFEYWGKTMGRMHSLTKWGNERLKSYNRPSWSGQKNETSQFLSTISVQASRAYETIIKKIGALPRNQHSYGLIHNDFHQGNFFVHDGEMAIFDFDDCSFSWFAQDIAVSFYHAAWQSSSFNPEYKNFPSEFIKCFFEGYSKENELKKETLEQIPLFLKLREIFLLHLFYKKWDIQNLQDWQSYTLKDLKYRIENEIPYTDVFFKAI